MIFLCGFLKGPTLLQAGSAPDLCDMSFAVNVLYATYYDTSAHTSLLDLEVACSISTKL